MLRPLILRTLFTNAGISIFALVNSILLSRRFGPAGRGEIVAAILWPTLLIYLSSMGLISSVLYFAAVPESKTQPIFANAMALAAVQSVAALIVGYAALPYLLHSQTSTVVNAGRLYLLVIPLSLFTQYGVSLIQGRMHIAAFNWLRTILPFGYMAGTLLLIVLGRLTLYNIIVLLLVINTVVLMATMGILSRSGIRPTFRTDRDLVKLMLKYGAKVHVGEVSQLANMRLDLIIMAAFLPPVYLGLYVVAVSASSLLQMFSLAVRMIMIPSIAQKESLGERAGILQGVFRRYWMLSIVIVLGIGVAMPAAIPAIFGASFKDAIWPAEVLLVGTLLVSAKDILSGGAQALGSPWLSSRADLAALVATVLLLPILLPILGILGAAIATAVACAIGLAVMIYGLRRSHDILPVQLFRIKADDMRSALDILSIIKGYQKSMVSGGG